jgi:hypothetical protein
MDCSKLYSDVASWLPQDLESHEQALQQAQGRDAKKQVMVGLVEMACSSEVKSAKAAAETSLKNIAPLLFAKEKFRPNPQSQTDKNWNLDNFGFESADAYLQDAGMKGEQAC